MRAPRKARLAILPMVPLTMVPVWEEEEEAVVVEAASAEVEEEGDARTVEVEVSCWPFDWVMMMVMATRDI